MSLNRSKKNSDFKLEKLPLPKTQIPTPTPKRSEPAHFPNIATHLSLQQRPNKTLLTYDELKKDLLKDDDKIVKSEILYLRSGCFYTAIEQNTETPEEAYKLHVRCKIINETQLKILWNSIYPLARLYGFHEIKIAIFDETTNYIIELQENLWKINADTGEISLDLEVAEKLKLTQRLLEGITVTVYIPEHFSAEKILNFCSKGSAILKKAGLTTCNHTISDHEIDEFYSIRCGADSRDSPGLLSERKLIAEILLLQAKRANNYKRLEQLRADILNPPQKIKETKTIESPAKLNLYELLLKIVEFPAWTNKTYYNNIDHLIIVECKIILKSSMTFKEKILKLFAIPNFDSIANSKRMLGYFFNALRLIFEKNRPKLGYDDLEYIFAQISAQQTVRTEVRSVRNNKPVSQRNAFFAGDAKEKKQSKPKVKLKSDSTLFAKGRKILESHKLPQKLATNHDKNHPADFKNRGFA